MQLNAEELRVQIVALAHLSGKDVDDLMACTVAELTQIAESAKLAAAPADKTAFDNITAVLNQIAAVVSPFTTIAGLASPIASLTSLTPKSS